MTKNVPFSALNPQVISEIILSLKAKHANVTEIKPSAVFPLKVNAITWRYTSVIETQYSSISRTLSSLSPGVRLYLRLCINHSSFESQTWRLKLLVPISFYHFGVGIISRVSCGIPLVWTIPQRCCQGLCYRFKLAVTSSYRSPVMQTVTPLA